MSYSNKTNREPFCSNNSHTNDRKFVQIYIFPFPSLCGIITVYLQHCGRIKMYKSGGDREKMVVSYYFERLV